MDETPICVLKTQCCLSKTPSWVITDHRSSQSVCSAHVVLMIVACAVNGYVCIMNMCHVPCVLGISYLFTVELFSSAEAEHVAEITRS